MAKTSVASLLRDGRIESIPADVPGGWARLEESEIHLSSSSALAKSDPTMAYVVLYDAARNAITALMLATGYRATNRPGAHQAVGLYAQSVLTDAPTLPTFGPSIGCAKSATGASTSTNRSLSAC